MLRRNPNMCGSCQLNKDAEGHCGFGRLTLSVCAWTNVGEGCPVASQVMTRSSMLKTVTDPGCVVITGGVMTVTAENKVTAVSYKKTPRVCRHTPREHTENIAWFNQLEPHTVVSAMPYTRIYMRIL